jgi:hypothetical protein
MYEWPLASGGRVLVINDALGGPHAEDESKLMGRLLMRFTGVSGENLGIARIYKTMMLKDTAPLKRLAGELANIQDLRLITVSHGECITRDCAAALRAVAAA